MKMGSSSSNEEENDEEKAAFKVKNVPLHFVRAVGTFNGNPAVRNPTYTNMYEQSVHFWRQEGE